LRVEELVIDLFFALIAKSSRYLFGCKIKGILSWKDIS